MNVSKDMKYFDKSFEILLYATTAGIATKRPNAVAKRASAIPGATTAKFVFCAIAIDLKPVSYTHLTLPTICSV